MKFLKNQRFLPWIIRNLEQFRIGPDNFLLGFAAVLVGLGSGAGVWVFKRLISAFNTLFFDWTASFLAPAGHWTVLLIPALAGLLVGLLVHYLIGEERHHGVAGIMEAVALAGGRLRYSRIPIKTLAAALSIGGGASVGPEDPSVQIGSNIGSLVGQVGKLTPDKVRTLVAAGAAGGIAAAFNAPIAGIFFALEIIMGEISGSSVGIVLLASITSAVFTQAVSGAHPAFSVPPYGYYSPTEFPFYAGLGLFAGALSAAYIFLLDRMRTISSRIVFPRWSKTFLAGLVVGLAGVFVPQALGIGYGTIEQVLSIEQVPVLLLVLFLLFKLILTPISIAGGFPGGVFAPALFLGAMLGGVYSGALDLAFPTLLLPRAAFAMVGMAAVLAGSVRAPLTAILLLFEMTNDYRIILPLMFAVVVSVVVSQRLQADSVYTLPLARKGIRLRQGRDVEVLQGISVREVMNTGFEALLESDSMLKAKQALWQAHMHALPVVDRSGKLVGILSTQDLQQLSDEVELSSVTAGNMCTRQLLVAFPDESLAEAMRRMSLRDIGQLPVVSREDAGQLLGLLSRAHMVRAYELALVRHETARHKQQQAQLGITNEVGIEEVRIDPGSLCDGKRIREIQWPEESVVASIRRGRHTIIPHGDTLLKPNDVLTIVMQEGKRANLDELCCRVEQEKTG